MTPDACERDEKGKISRRGLITAWGRRARRWWHPGSCAARRRRARRWPRRARSPPRRATSARAGRRTCTSPIPTSSRSSPRSTASGSRTPRSSGCGPARCGRKGRRGAAQGRYLVWSDIPNNRQMRWLEDNGHVSVFRTPSNNSNGNTFDFQGRQLSCEHLTRRVVRYELDGSVDHHRGHVRRQAAQLAERRRAAPGRQLLVHRPALRRPALRGHGGRAGRADQPGGPAQPAARASRPRSATLQARTAHRGVPRGSERPRHPGGGRGSGAGSERALLLAGLQEALRGEHRPGARRHPPGGKGEMYVFDVGADNKLSNGKLFTNFMVDGVKCGPDGVRGRRGGQPLVLEQCRPQRGLQRRDGVDAAGPAHRAHPPARDLRQRLLRRAQAQPPLHGRQPVALRGLHAPRAPRPARSRRIGIGSS